jgi:hypothetical protein
MSLKIMELAIIDFALWSHLSSIHDGTILPFTFEGIAISLSENSMAIW